MNIKNIIHIILVFCIFIISNINLFACTTFVLQKNDQLLFGRNLDWVSDNGIISINQRNVNKTSLVFPPHKPIKWKSKYGSVTFNQFGKEFPYGGINEVGLVIEIMVANAEYENFDNRNAINELQWIQFQLDNYTNIEEVINSNTYLRITPVNQQLHYFICDKEGNRAVIEYIGNKMVVYQDDKLPISVLENSLYKKSLDQYKNNKKSRFCTATKLLNNLDEELIQNNKINLIEKSFSILKEVVLSGEWSIVYDISNMKVYFKTKTNQNLKYISINEIDFNCNTKQLFYNLQKENKGKINTAMEEFNSKINYDKFTDAVNKNQLDLPKDILKVFQNYHKTCICN